MTELEICLLVIILVIEGIGIASTVQSLFHSFEIGMSLGDDGEMMALLCDDVPVLFVTDPTTGIEDRELRHQIVSGLLDLESFGFAAMLPIMYISRVSLAQGGLICKLIGRLVYLWSAKRFASKFKMAISLFNEEILKK